MTRLLVMFAAAVAANDCLPNFTKVGASVPVLTEVVKFDKSSDTFFTTADGAVKQFKMTSGEAVQDDQRRAGSYAGCYA